MAKVTLEFDYYEDKEELEMFHRAPRVESIVWDAYNFIRDKLKHGDLDDETYALLIEINERLFIEDLM